MDDVDSIAGLINASEKTLLIVGHLPHLGKLTSLLITGNASASLVNFQQGGVLCLQRMEQAGWAISWMLTPGLIA
jgi:phosphohistidine phosphatase